MHCDTILRYSNTYAFAYGHLLISHGTIVQLPQYVAIYTCTYHYTKSDVFETCYKNSLVLPGSYIFVK